MLQNERLTDGHGMGSKGHSEHKVKSTHRTWLSGALAAAVEAAGVTLVLETFPTCEGTGKGI